MPFIPAENTARVVMSFTQGGQIVANTFYVRLATQPDGGDLTLIAVRVTNWWIDVVQDLQHNSVSLTSVEATDMTEEGSSQITFTTGLPLSGNHGGAALPNNATLSVKLSTGLTGRSHRGRQYFIGLSDGELADANHINATMVVGLQNAYVNLINAMTEEGWELVIASFISGGAPRLTAELTPVINASANSTIDSQRRRLPERGS